MVVMLTAHSAGHPGLYHFLIVPIHPRLVGGDESVPAGKGPSPLRSSVKSRITSANFAPSEAEIHSRRNLFLSIPIFSKKRVAFPILLSAL